MTERELLRKALELRELQKEYFRRRNPNVLDQCRIKEREFDKLLHDYFNIDGQSSLDFDGS